MEQDATQEQDAETTQDAPTVDIVDETQEAQGPTQDAPTVEPNAEIDYATYSPEDNKLRIYPRARLSPELYARVRANGFIWAAKQGLFVAPAWTPGRADFAEELAGDIEDETITLEQRAEQRAARFEVYQGKRADDATRAAEGVKQITNGIPLGQPILVGHHSERHARKDAERIENGMRKAVKMWETSAYWERRAAGAVANAEYKELPGVRARRIKGIEADKRKRERSKKENETALAFWTQAEITIEKARIFAGYGGSFPCCPSPHGHSYSAYDVLQEDGQRFSACPAWTLQQVIDRARVVYPRYIAYAERWIQHFENRLTYEKTMLEAQGASALIAPKARPKQLPLLNYKAPEGVDVMRYNRIDHVRQVEMTTAQYAGIYEDYRGTLFVDGTHRIRCARVQNDNVIKRFPEHVESTYCAVYLTDSKEHKRPAKPDIAPTPAPKVAPVYTPRPPVELTQAEKDCAAMKASLKGGVQVVTAPQLFPTPPALVKQLLELADVRPGMQILEPSAGTGALIEGVFNGTFPDTIKTTACEINASLCTVLENVRRKWMHAKESNFKIVHGDFLEQTPEELGTFHRVIMNPPFENGSDIKHVQHARRFLKAGGMLAAIVANGPRQRAAFEDAAQWIDLPANSFAAQGTGVNTAMILYYN